MQLPVEVDDQRVYRFIAYWESLRTSSDLPVWDVAAARHSIPDLMPCIAAIEVRDPPSLYVRHAGNAYFEHYGYEISGTDLLQYTLPDDKAERFRRFQIIATQPCGMLFVAPVLGSHNISVIGDVIWLPMRDQNSNEIVLVTLHGLSGPKVYDERPHSIMPLAEKFAFVDIGFGAPPPPGYWATVKTAVTRKINTFRALLS